MQKTFWILERKHGNDEWFLSAEDGIPLDGYPSLDALYAEADAKKIPRALLSAPAILKKRLASAKAFPGEAFSFQITCEPSFDVRLNVSNDRLSAKLYIRKARGAPHSLDMKLISSVLNTSKIKFSNPDALKAKIYEFRDSPDMELADFVVATGVPPKRGADGKLLDRVKWLEGDELSAYKKRIGEWEKTAHAAKISAVHGVPKAASPAAKLAFVVKDDIVFEFERSPAGEPGRDVYGAAIPGLSGNDPAVKLGENLVLTNEGVKAAEHGALLAETVDGVLYAKVYPYCDAYADIAVSPDKMEAVLTAAAEVGAGEPLSFDFIVEKAKKKGVTAEFDAAAVEAFIRSVKASGCESKMILARGIQPVPPGAPAVRWFGQAGEGKIVSAGDKILSYRVLDMGQNGVDVTGRSVVFHGAAALPVPQSDPATVEEKQADGWTWFSARISGEIVKKGAVISVSDTREINGDISPEDGAELFPGKLRVNGNVAKGASVKSLQMLTVNGNISASIVSAEDSVFVNGGIKGAKLGTVWAKHNIDITFAENARLLGGGDIRVEKYCFQCTVKTNSKLFVKGAPGVLVGGTVHARHGIDVTQLGSPQGLRTMIFFGQDYIVADQIEVSERELNTVRKNIEVLTKRAEGFAPDNPQLAEFRRQKLALLKRKDKLTLKIFTLKEIFEQHFPSKIKVEGNVYPGVLLESHGRFFEVQKKLSHVVFTFDQSSGKIVCSPISDGLPDDEMNGAEERVAPSPSGAIVL